MCRRTLRCARYTLTVNGVDYAAANVPLLVRGSKSRGTAVKVKPPKNSKQESVIGDRRGGMLIKLSRGAIIYTAACGRMR